jgi:uncharacterized membrane protein YdjX (TVP38/TMEM64 family)
MRQSDSVRRRGRLPLILAASGAAALALAYLIAPAFRSLARHTIDALLQADAERMREYLLGFGAWAPIVSALLMVLQALLLPLPSVALTLANGLVFGTGWGTLLSWSSALLAAVICYYLARLFGRPMVTRLVGGNALALADRFFERHGAHAVLLARLIPGISFDVVSYVAGLSSVRLGPFVLATAIGQLPATLAYSFLGANLSQAARWKLGIVLGVMALLVLGLAIRSALKARLLSEHEA